MRALLQMVSRREDSSLFGPGGGHSEASGSASSSSSKGGLNSKQAFGSSGSMSAGGSMPSSGGSGGYMQSSGSGGSQQQMSKPASGSSAAQSAASAAAQQQQNYRPAFHYMTANPKNKEAAYAWFRQLANNEPLAKLAKKIPLFNKRVENLPEILITLYEYRVSISRAVWYLKIMVLANSASQNEVNTSIKVLFLISFLILIKFVLKKVNKKKRQTNVDVSSEWSIPLMRFLREILTRLQYIDLQQLQNSESGGTTTTTSMTSGSNMSKLSLESFMNVENLNLVLLPIINHSYLTEFKLRSLWSFATRLMRAMLDQNLLDKQFVLESLLDLLEKSVGNGLTAAAGLMIPGVGGVAGPGGASRATTGSSASSATGAPSSNSASSFESHSCKLILSTGKIKRRDLFNLFNY